MERQFYTDDFEQLLKEKSDEFRMYPSKRVWHSIYNDLHPGRKWPSVAVSLILIIALLIVGYWNNNAADSTTIAAIPSQKNTTLLETNGPIKYNPFQTASYYLLSEDATPANQQPAAPQTVFAFNNIFSKVIIAASDANSNKNASAQEAEKNNTASQSIFDNIGFTSIGLNNTNTVTVLSSETISLNNDIALLDPSAKINTEKQTPGIQTPGIKTTANSSAKENGYTVTTAPVKSNNEVVVEESNSGSMTQQTTGLSAEASAKADNGQQSIGNSSNGENVKATGEDKKTATASSTLTKTSLSTEDKSWIEDYAFHNKSKRKKWQDRTSISFYITPSVGYRRLSNDPKYNIPSATPSLTNSGSASETVDHTPGLGMEAGVMLNYALAKKIKVKAGIQANYTSYGINAGEINHPVLTTLMFIDPNSGFPYMHSAASTLTNAKGSQPIKVHNTTYQVSVPLGFALKLAGNNKLEWYAGATIQPTFVIGGKAYLISADRMNYVADASLIRKWNINTGFETYINYKFDGFTLQAGPQFRYQALSTYYKKYTVNENLSNIGLKLGIVKNF